MAGTLGVTFLCMVFAARCGDDKLVSVGGSKFQVTFLEADLRGSSVRIVGSSSFPDTERLRCVNSTEQCFEVTESIPILSLEGLCPSVSEQKGLWNFSYDIFHGTKCQGTKRNEILLMANTSQENLVCLDEADEVMRQHPNQTWNARIMDGAKPRKVSCFQDWASQSLALSMCAVVKPTPMTLDCGCVWAGNACSCNGLTPGPKGNLPPNCFYEEKSCLLVCP